MAKIKILGSGSSGNCYIIECQNEKLILELGVSWNKVMKGISFNISNISACLVSHIHVDHAQYIPNALKYQIPVFSCKEVCDKYKGVRLLQPKKGYKIGGFIVMPLPVQHNAENYAYIIEHEEFGKMVFYTDCTSFPYIVRDVNIALAEMNYSQEIVLDKLCDGGNIRSHNEYHCEIDKSVEALKRLKNNNLNTIVGIHLSDGLSNEKMFTKRVLDEVGIAPVMAIGGMELEINKEEF